MPSAKSRTLCASAAGPPFSGATSRWLKFPDGRKVSDLIALDLWHFWQCVIVNENKWPPHHPCPRKGTVCVIGERLWKQQDQSILGTIVILFKCCKSHFLASAVLVEKQCLSSSSPRHTKMSKKGLNAHKKTKLWWEPHTKITSSFTCGTITKSQNTWDSIRQTLGCFSPQELLFCSKMLVSYKTVLFALVWETNRLQRNSVSLGEKLQRIFVSVEWHCTTLHVVGKMSTDRL